MAQFRVIKPIEFGPPGKVKMYFPVGYWGFAKGTKNPAPPPTKTVSSGCNGADIEVDASGIIDLPEDVAAQLNLGQIAPLDPDSEPTREGYEMLGKALQETQKIRGTEDSVQQGDSQKWVAGAPREVTPLSVDGTLKVG